MVVKVMLAVPIAVCTVREGRQVRRTATQNHRRKAVIRASPGTTWKEPGPNSRYYQPGPSGRQDARVCMSDAPDGSANPSEGCPGMPSFPAALGGLESLVV